MSDYIRKIELLNWLENYKKKQTLASAIRATIEIMREIDSNSFDVCEPPNSFK